MPLKYFLQKGLLVWGGREISFLPQMTELFEHGENIEGEGDNAGHQHFLPEAFNIFRKPLNLFQGHKHSRFCCKELIGLLENCLSRSE